MKGSEKWRLNKSAGKLLNSISWSNGIYAKVVSIYGVEEGKPIEGDPSYFKRVTSIR
jgi:hypothetical protein